MITIVPKFSNNETLLPSLTMMHFYYSIIVPALLLPTLLAPTAAFTVNEVRHIKQQQSRLAATAFNIDTIEAQAVAAAEAWDTSVTSFLTTAEATAVYDQLGNRGDVACFRVGGRQETAPSRARFVFTNPELGLTAADLEQEHCAILVVKNAKSGQDPWPNILTQIGIELDQVGDVLVSEGSIYLAVTPDVVKQCTRLLPKEIVGAGVSIQTLEPGEFMPEVS